MSQPTTAVISFTVIGFIRCRLFEKSLAPVVSFCLLSLFVGLTGQTASGQLLFTTLNNSNLPIVGQANTNGAGIATLNLPGLAFAVGARYSNNGQLIAVLGQTNTQLQQNMISLNAFVFNPATNQIGQLSNFEDVFIPANPLNPTAAGQRLLTIPRNVSFSPDGSILAVSSSTVFSQSDGVNSESLDGRTLTFFRVSDGQQLGTELVDTFFIGSSSGGQGVSWSPTEDVIAYPRTTQSQNPLISGPTPISSFNSSGQLLGNLTFPIAGNVNGPFSETFIEHDYFPAFSPNGVALAYFRSTRIGFTSTASLLSLRITSPSGDRAVLNFQPGQLPAGVTWSTDGTQLFYSVGNQPILGGFLRGFDVDPASTRIGVVNIDGSGNATLITPPAAFPEIFPGNSVSGQGDFNNNGQVNIADLDFFSGNLGQSASGALAQLDLDGNGTITLADHDLLITQFLQTSAGVGSIVGDIDLNGTVDVLGDAFVLVGNLGSSGPFSYGGGDLNADQRVDVLGDAFRLVGNLGMSR